MRTQLNTRTPVEANHSSASTPFFQPKLTINQPNDVYEQEADAMAEKVMRISEPKAEKTFFSSSVMQTKGNYGERDVQKHEIAKEHSIKLKTNSQTEPAFHSINNNTLNKATYLKVHSSRNRAICVEEEKLQRKKDVFGETEVGAATEQYIKNLSGGHPLNTEQRSFFESRMGYDFSGVRVHNDGAAHQSAKNINAVAFTHGNNIVFRSGQYNPDTYEGKNLIAHELTHVVQQEKAVKTNVQRKPAKQKSITYQFKVPEGITTLEQWGKYLNIKIYGNENAAKWSYGDPDIKPGQIRIVEVTGDSLNADADQQKKEEHESGNEEFNLLSPADQQKINKEADERFSEISGQDIKIKIKPGETGKANTWNDARDEILKQKKNLESLPDAIKQLMGGDSSFQPKDYDQLQRIGEKLKHFSQEDIAIYKMLALKATDDLNLFEQSVDLFLARKKQLEEAMKDNPLSPSVDKDEPASMQEALERSWKDFDASKLGTMSEAERGSLARKRAWEVTKAQLKYMKDHPGETAADFAKSATLMNTGETFKGIADDLKEAANGDAKGYARWASGTGAGAKLSGWLLAVGAIVYVLSWLTGVGELATIAAFMAYMLGATIALSATEAELRIKAASKATTEEEFKKQVTQAGVAYTNVLISVAMLVVALGIKFLAKTFFPQTLKNIQESLARFRERVRIKGGLKEMLPEFESEMKGYREKLVASGETAKKGALAKADDLVNNEHRKFYKKS